MEGPGTITWDEFLKDVESFIDISNNISDGWELRGDKNVPGEAYIIREHKRYMSNDNYFTQDNQEFENHFNFTLQQDPFDDSRLAEKPIYTEHHILWSMSYSVPVIYFNGWKSDFPGVNRISVEEAQSFCNNGELKYKELSQTMHPILGTPFLYLHPCMSHELIKSISKSKNKLVSWLSIVAPTALNLTLAMEYSKLTV